MKKFCFLLGLTTFTALFFIDSAAASCDPGWVAYEDEKCFKIIDQLLHQDEAESLCRAQSGPIPDPLPPLLTIRSGKEQIFLTNLIFNQSAIVDNVWLSGKRLNGIENKFLWGDGSEMTFTNWHEGSPSDIEGNDCTQMVPKGLKFGPQSIAAVMANEDGLWSDTSCSKRNLVVCQKLQGWFLLEIQLTLLEVRKELRDEVTNLRENPVPLGFVYVQLPGQEPPVKTWPTVDWADVTVEYAGLFFRAEGNGSAPFESRQEDNTRRISKVTYANRPFQYWSTTIDLPVRGWSAEVQSGYFTNGTSTRPDHDESLKFLTTDEEVRPKNTAVRIWKRIK